jgi:DNA-binding XRE family transcriptional regulator
LKREKLRKARLLRKLTQKDLARIVGVSFQTISKYELGKVAPREKVWKKISRALNMPVESLW